MTPRKILAQLQRKSKLPKHGNKRVYACRLCWHLMILIDKKPARKNDILLCTNCNLDGYRYDCTVFDSLAEHTRGLELQMLKQAEVITDLEHHKKFKLAPKAYYFNDGPFFKMFQSDEKNGIEITHRYRQWESDYTYMMKGEKVVEEVKRLTKIVVIRTKVDRLSCETVKIREKIDFPRFVNDEDFRHFRKICQLMLAIHGHRVQVWAGGLWMFTDEWELERVHGRIK